MKKCKILVLWYHYIGGLYNHDRGHMPHRWSDSHITLEVSTITTEVICHTGEVIHTLHWRSLQSRPRSYATQVKWFTHYIGGLYNHDRGHIRWSDSHYIGGLYNHDRGHMPHRWSDSHITLEVSTITTEVICHTGEVIHTLHWRSLQSRPRSYATQVKWFTHYIGGLYNHDRGHMPHRWSDSHITLEVSTITTEVICHTGGVIHRYNERRLNVNSNKKGSHINRALFSKI